MVPTWGKAETVKTVYSTEPLKGLKILVVDDQPDTPALISTVLRRAGAEVHTVTNVPEAFKLVVKLRPDVLISDIGMPDLDGYDLIRMIRNLPPNMGGNIPAIALTAYAHDYDHRRSMEMGFQEHLAKPTEAKHLVRVVSRVAGRGPREH